MTQTIYVLIEASRFEPLAFSSREKLLEYFQEQNPRAKHLRVKDIGPYDCVQILNHNTPVTYWWRQALTKVVLDVAIRNAEEQA